MYNLTRNSLVVSFTFRFSNSFNKSTSDLNRLNYRTLLENKIINDGEKPTS